MSELLNKIIGASPCSESWDNMQGDERVRNCLRCSRSVYNLSDMTRAEAEQFLLQNETSQCLRFWRRPDGKITTDECPVALRSMRRRIRLVIGFAASALASLSALAFPIPAFSQQDNKKTPNRTEKPAIGAGSDPGYFKGTFGSLGPNKGGIAFPIPAIAEPFMGDTIYAAPGAEGPPPLDDLALRPKQTYILPNDCINEGAGDTGQKKKANVNIFADSRAYDLYRMAIANKKDGLFFWAKMQLEEALTITESQKNSDPIFVHLLKDTIKEIDDILKRPADPGSSIWGYPQ